MLLSFRCYSILCVFFLMPASFLSNGIFFSFIRSESFRQPSLYPTAVCTLLKLVFPVSWLRQVSRCRQSNTEIDNVTFTELSLTIRGVPYSLPRKIIALFAPLNCFGGKGGRFDPWKNRPKRTHPPRKHVFGCTERKSTLLRVSCGRIEGTKKK